MRKSGCTVDLGQGQAAALWEQAGAGEFRMEAGAAQRCADVFVQFAESLEGDRLAAEDVRLVEGFGGFDSAIQLQDGFAAKGEKLVEAIFGLQEAALRMAAAYLRAGQLFEEADAMNREAIGVAARGMPE